MKPTQRKTSTATSAATEECGVWLDVAELRAKKPKKRLTRPISKLLNPLAQSGGYSLAVALNFTQTKLDMPATKQSTISSFFQPQRRTSKPKEERRTSHCSEMSFTPLPRAHAGIKRKHGTAFELSSESSKDTSHISQVHPQDSDASFKRETGEFCKDSGKEKHFLNLIWGFDSEEPEPAEKRRRPEDVIFENNREVQKEADKAIFDGFRPADEIEDIPEILQHDSNEHSNQKHGKGGSSAHNSVKGFQSQEPLRTCIQRPVFTTRSVVESQNAIKHQSKAQKEPELCEPYQHRIQGSPEKTKYKENSRATSPSLHVKHRPLQEQFPHSPAQLFSKVKYGQSSKKSVKELLGDEGDSLAMLFTQDSDGFRVIANHKGRVRCPLKDCTNSAEGIDYSNIPKPLEPEDTLDLEPEMLFTQDSLGNMVIKH
ncbi:uncharacterized protein aunip [Brachyhypopomus gauderio]|uniref:uncharacterized protein aunip n=1 Tax=Brachyhypopomus gauderio TaxID=698409 RepID=UPI0040416DDA